MAAKNTNFSNSESLIYQNEFLKLTVLGGIKLDGLDRMRSTLKIELKESSAPLLRQNIDLLNYNQTEKLNDVTAHAEMLAFTAASEYLGNKYLHDCTLYVTVEPCIMCAGASYWAQLKRVVFGTNEPKRGYRRVGNLLHPKTEMVSGIMAQECADLMASFFAAKRK